MTKRTLIGLPGEDRPQLPQPGSPLLYPRTKGECEAAITAIGFTTVVIVRPSFLLGARAERRSGETVALHVGPWLRPLLVGPLRKYAPVEAITVARTLVSAAATAPAGATIIESDSIRTPPRLALRQG